MKRGGFSLAETIIGVAISVATILVVMQTSNIVKKAMDSKGYVSAYKQSLAAASAIREMISKSGVLFESLNIPQCLLTFHSPGLGTISVPFGPVAIFKPVQHRDVNSAQMAIVWNTLPLYHSSFMRFTSSLRPASSSSDPGYYLDIDRQIPSFPARYAFLFRFRDSLIPSNYPPFCQLAAVSNPTVSSSINIMSSASSGGINFSNAESVFPPSGNNFSWLYNGHADNAAPSGSTMKTSVNIAIDATTGGYEILKPGESSTTGTSITSISASPYMIYSSYGLNGPAYGMLSAGSAHVDTIYVDAEYGGGLYVKNLISGRVRNIGPGVVSLQAQYGIVSSPGKLDWYNPTSFNNLLTSGLLKVGNIDIVRFAVLTRANYDKHFNSPVPTWAGGSFTMANYPEESGDRANWRHWRYALVEMDVPIRNVNVSAGYMARDN
ncbi:MULTISPECIES: hypothetical protein [Candidatus Ichthyocystis]|uniref:hypothetical protein n=1 Tax=Candidatus Ichthyocystis TaxID=2929841 RepID=UPI000B8283AE|nr:MULTISPECIES: hypothetical protein [Ichthyocystis]